MEDELISDFEGLVEGIVTNDVSAQAGRSAEAIGVFFLARLAGSLDIWAVRHFEDVGHVGGGGNIKDGDFDSVFYDINDAADEDATAGGNRFPRLEKDFELRVAGLDFTNDPDEARDIVVIRGDEVAAAHIEPFHLFEVFVKLGNDMLKRALKGVRALFAERVEMKPLDALEIIGGEVFGEDAKAGAGSAGVVDFGTGFGVFGVNAKSGGDRAVRTEDLLAIAMPLGHRIEDDVIGDFHELVHFRRFVSGGKDMNVASELLGSKAGFVESTGGGPCKIVAENGIDCRAGESLLGEENLGPGFVLNVLEDTSVVVEGSLIEDVGGGFEPAFKKGAGDLRNGSRSLTVAWNGCFCDERSAADSNGIHGIELRRGKQEAGKILHGIGWPVNGVTGPETHAAHRKSVATSCFGAAQIRPGPSLLYRLNS